MKEFHVVTNSCPSVQDGHVFEVIKSNLCMLETNHYNLQIHLYNRYRRTLIEQYVLSSLFPFDQLDCTHILQLL